MLWHKRAVFSAVLCSLATLQTYAEPSAKPAIKTGLVIFSAGSWMVFSNNDRQSYFNKLSTTTYGQFFGVKTMFSVPLDLTVHTRPDGSSKRFWPGDFDCYFARRIGWIEPRIGALLPLGYAIDDDWKRKAWIGTNNIRLQGGFSISKADFEHIGIPFGMEAMLSVAVTDRNAQYVRGSLGGQLYLKSSLNLTKKVNLGAELAVYGKAITWKWNKLYERGCSLMPTLFASYRVTGKVYAGCKAGFGPSFQYDKQRLHRRSYACDAGVSVQYYP